jgi:hypothetical protein
MHFNVVVWLPKRARADCANLKWEHAAYAIDYLFLLVLFSVSSSSRFVIPGQRGVVHVQSLFHQVRFRSLLTFVSSCLAKLTKQNDFFVEVFRSNLVLSFPKNNDPPYVAVSFGWYSSPPTFCYFFFFTRDCLRALQSSEHAPATPIDLNEIRHAVTWKRVV